MKEKKIRDKRLVLELIRLTTGKGPVVFSDLDNTLRWVKEPVSSCVEHEILEFRKNGGLFLPISGGARLHIPKFLIDPIAFAESGALLIYNHRVKILATPKELAALKSLSLLLGVHVKDGLCKMLEQYTAIIEGPREAALTIISGKHPLYPGIESDVPIEKVENVVRRLIEKHSMPLRVLSGILGTYFWLDITTMFKKEQAVVWFRDVIHRPYVYYLGDGINDYEAMNLLCVIPVGFKNSVPEIKDLIRARGGILIENKTGPDGGVSEALKIILEKEKDGSV